LTDWKLQAQMADGRLQDTARLSSASINFGNKLEEHRERCFFVNGTQSHARDLSLVSLRGMKPN